MYGKKKSPKILCAQLAKAFGGRGKVLSAKREYHRMRQEHPYSRVRVACQISGAKARPQLYLKDGRHDDLDEIMREADFHSYDIFLSPQTFIIEFETAGRVKHEGKWYSPYD